MEITRIGLLSEQLTAKEELKFKYSHNRCGLVAMPGYETIFEDLVTSCSLLREMIREEQHKDARRQLQSFVDENRDALEKPEVQERIRGWQQDLMFGRGIDTSWADQKAEDGGVKRTAGGFVVYPGGGEK